MPSRTSSRTKHSNKLFEALGQAVAFHQAGELGEAERLYRAVLRSEPRQFDALHLLGLLEAGRGRNDEALRLLDRALAINPRSADALNNRANVLSSLERYDEALASCERALALRPDFAEALNNRGNALHDLKRYQEALASYDRALAIRPHYAKALANRANALRDLKRYEEALASCNRALALVPDFAEALNNRASVLHEMKRYEEALAWYDNALAIMPDYAKAFNNRASVLRALKRYDEAIAAYRRALQLKPQDPSTLNNLALAVMDQHRDEEAVALLSRSATFDPKNGRTLIYLATALRHLDRLDEASEVAQRALELLPDDPDALNVKGRVLLDQNRVDDAIGLFRTTIERKPDMADAYNNLGIALKVIGRSGEALAAYHKALDVEPKMTFVFVNLGDAWSFKSADDPHLRAMEELMRDTASISEDERMQLCFALSKAYADLERHDESFQLLLEGNAIKRKQTAYDEAATHALFDHIPQVFTPELVRAHRGAGDPSSVPVFVLGMPRSGSTLVEQILASHPKIFGAGELKDFDTVVKTVRGPDGAVVPFPDFVPAFGAAHYRSLGEQYLRRLAAYSRTAERITNKMPSSFFFIGLIHLALPNARIIHTMRNPVDTCLSCYSKLFTGVQPFTYDLGELGRYYRKYDELMRHWRSVLPEGAMLDVQYEDVVADFETQARRIVAYCGLEWDDACRAFYQAKRPVRTASAFQVRQPIFKSSVGRWLPYKNLLRPLLEELQLDEQPAQSAS